MVVNQLRVHGDCGVAALRTGMHSLYCELPCQRSAWPHGATEVNLEAPSDAETTT